MTPEQRDKLVTEFEVVINRHSAENDSDTPDFILAEYLMGCLEQFGFAAKARDKWYGRDAKKAETKPVGG